MLLRRLFEKMKPALRVGAFTGCVFLGIGGFAAHSVYGDVREQTVILGRELASMADVLHQSQRVNVNGESLFVAEATVEGDRVHEVMDRFEKLCRDNSQGLDEVVTNPAAFPDKAREALQKLGTTGLGILRYENNGEGSIACLASDEGGGLKGLAARLKRFSKSMDLADVGKLRYVYARPTDRGRTQVVTVWTDGSLKIGNMFPIDGSEPPGTDPTDMPRPPDSQRLLTAEVTGAPYGVRIYTSKATPDAVLATYDAAMPNSGWTLQEMVGKAAPGTRSYRKEDADVLVFAQPDGERTAVSIIEMRAKDR